MSKYDFEMDVSNNTSTGLIVNKIEKGSVILEFGCATGRMTRYMKEVLDCKVYIVEYDQVAFEKAKEYAADGLCDDIMTFQWYEKFNDILFDAIIFADVLEHLTEPEKVLEYSERLLKKNGCILVSIPNVTHNDIILKAYEEHFDYTPTGLLDNTHLRFWGLKNVEQLSGKYGLYIRSIEGTYCSTGDTEQFWDGSKYNRGILYRLLKERICGEVYQFIITFDKCERKQPIHRIKREPVQCSVYLEPANKSGEEKEIVIDADVLDDGAHIVHCVIEHAEDIASLRVIPTDEQECVMRNFSIIQGKTVLPVEYVNTINLNNGVLFSGSDSYVTVDSTGSIEPIVVRMEFVSDCESYFKELEDTLRYLYPRIMNLNNILDFENQRLREELGHYKKLADSKDKQVTQLKQDLEGYKNLKVVKWYSRIMHFIKR